MPSKGTDMSKANARQHSNLHACKHTSSREVMYLKRLSKLNARSPSNIHTCTRTFSNEIMCLKRQMICRKKEDDVTMLNAHSHSNIHTCTKDDVPYKGEDVP